LAKGWYSELPHQSRVALWALFAGWVVDVYDVYIVAFLGLLIAHVYLAPYLGAGAYVQELYAAGSLTATLVARGVGSFIFGPIADSRGRKNPLMATLLGYSVFTLLTAFTVEIVRPFFSGDLLPLAVITTFVAFRVGAGLFLGGEWTVGAPYLSEFLPSEVRARATSLMQAGAPLGQLLAALIPFLLIGVMGNGAFSQFGWKLAFILGALPALLAVYVRFSLPESPAWQNAKKRKQKFSVGLKPMVQTLMVNVGMFVCVYAVVASYGTYVGELYGSTTLQVFGFHMSPSFMLLIVISAVGVFSTVFFGQIGDSLGRKRGLLIGSLGFLILSPVAAAFWQSKPSLPYLLLASSAYSFFVGSTGLLPAYVSERYSSAVGRATGAAAYNGNLLVTGWVPSLVAVVGHSLFRGPLASQFAFGMFAFSVIGSLILMVSVALGPETKGVELNS